MNNKNQTMAGARRNWKWIVGIGALFLFVAFLLVLGGAAGLAWTSTEKFCIGCHEMRDNVYAEYKDCHVPREPVPLMLRKMRATFEVWGHLTGVIDTKEKFETHRAMLAQRVWKRMKETDSHECRNCHVEEKMDTDKQTEKARARHEKGKAEGLTCIDCHFGIAHKEPEGPGPREMSVAPKP
jgi:cytochrome c-type protein NapC